MRKVSFLLVMFALAAGITFAQDIEFFDVEIGVGFPIHWTNGQFNKAVYEEYDKPVTASTSIGLTFNFNFSQKMGAVVDLDVFYGAKVIGISSTDANFLSMFGFNVYLGPQFYLYNKGQLRIPLFIGPHVYFFSDESWNGAGLSGGSEASGSGYVLKTQDWQIGLALGLGVQFHFDSNIYIFSRTNVAFDFVRILRQTGYDYDGITEEGQTRQTMGLSLNWLVKPSLGVGIKF
ncbi:MAG: hypothetical protein FWC06_04545 [Treponema sp.]|nr:hypothetical protein [Treponema sp.]